MNDSQQKLSFVSHYLQQTLAS